MSVQCNVEGKRSSNLSSCSLHINTRTLPSRLHFAWMHTEPWWLPMFLGQPTCSCYSSTDIQFTPQLMSQLQPHEDRYVSLPSHSGTCLPLTFQHYRVTVYFA